MNHQQKSQIEQYRKAGLGFMDIARRLDIPLTTVKSYCYRHPLPGAEEADEAFCPQCGQPVPRMRFRPRRFCSDACRVEYWHAHPDEMNHRSTTECRCQQCGKPFTDYAGRNRKYCSHPCCIAARYGGEQNG